MILDGEMVVFDGRRHASGQVDVLVDDFWEVFDLTAAETAAVERVLSGCGFRNGYLALDAGED